jgi:hypothetical protein
MPTPPAGKKAVVENAAWCGEHEERLELPVTKPFRSSDDVPAIPGFPNPQDCTHDAP